MALTNRSRLTAEQERELAEAIIAESERIGMEPQVMATIMAYETGGTMDPWQKGPKTKWGVHRGLIQMGGPQREEYGYKKSNSIADNVRSAANYLVGRGWRSGMPEVEAYSIVNAGRPGLSHRTDAHAGGAPGTVADKVAGGDWASYRNQVTEALANYDARQPVSEGLSAFADRLGGLEPDQTAIAPVTQDFANVPSPDALPNIDATGFGMEPTGLPGSPNANPRLRDILASPTTKPVTPSAPAVMSTPEQMLPQVQAAAQNKPNVAVNASGSAGLGPAFNANAQARVRPEVTATGSPNSFRMDASGSIRFSEPQAPEQAPPDFSAVSPTPSSELELDTPIRDFTLRPDGVISFPQSTTPERVAASSPAGGVPPTPADRVSGAFEAVGAQGPLSGPVAPERINQAFEAINGGSATVSRNPFDVQKANPIDIPNSAPAPTTKPIDRINDAFGAFPPNATNSPVAPTTPTVPGANLPALEAPKTVPVRTNSFTNQGRDLSKIKTLTNTVSSVRDTVSKYGGPNDPGNGMSYGYSPYGSGVALVHDSADEQTKIAASGPGIFGAFERDFGVDIEPFAKTALKTGAGMVATPPLAMGGFALGGPLGALGGALAPKVAQYTPAGNFAARRLAGDPFGKQHQADLASKRASGNPNLHPLEAGARRLAAGGVNAVTGGLVSPSWGQGGGQTSGNSNGGLGSAIGGLFGGIGRGIGNVIGGIFGGNGGGDDISNNSSNNSWSQGSWSSGYSGNNSYDPLGNPGGRI